MAAERRMIERELYFFVGREKELQQFQNMLDRCIQEDARKDILHFYGTGGVGKSNFLRICRYKAQEAGACFLLLDSRDFVHTERGIAEALLCQIREQMGEVWKQGVLPDHPWERCMEAIAQIASERRVVLAFDTFEEMQDLESWLQDRLLPRLPKRMIVLQAGRHSLRGDWMYSPAWRERLVQLPMEHLDRTDCLDYLRRCGVSEERMERIWLQTKGHPLTLSLAASAHAIQEQEVQPPGSEWFGEIASLWLREVPDQELRKLVESASVLQHFNQELLSYVLDEDLPPDVFDRLTALSFVGKSARGWHLHDLMRDSARLQLRERSPRLYKRLKERSAVYYARSIIDSAGHTDMGWEVGELFRYAGIEEHKALTGEYPQGYYWEPVTDSSLADAIAYVEVRQKCREGISGITVDPETGVQFRIEYTAEEVRFNTFKLDVNRLYHLEPESIKLLRDEDGRAIALAAIVPFHSGTLHWLKLDPFCGPYLDTLSTEELHRLRTPRERPAGWFIRAMDYLDLLDTNVRTSAIYLLYRHLCAGGIVVISPFAHEINHKVFTGFGFSIVEGATHCSYDGKTVTPTYALDTRGHKLHVFLEGLLRKAGMQWKDADRASAELIAKLTNREREVVDLVLSGYSNAEAAGRLFISEATVKKHLKSVYGKLKINNRLQLVRLVNNWNKLLDDR